MNCVGVQHSIGGSGVDGLRMRTPSITVDVIRGNREIARQTCPVTLTLVLRKKQATRPARAPRDFNSPKRAEMIASTVGV